MKRNHSPLLAASCSLGLLFSGASIYATVSGPGCAITNLPAIPNAGFQVYALNAAGQVAGYYYINEVHPEHAFIYQDGVLTDLGTLGGSVSCAYALNSSGVVGGQAYIDWDVEAHGFIHSGGSPEDLGTLGGGWSLVSAINDLGTAVGYSSTATDEAMAFVYSGGTMESLGTLGSNYSIALAINSSGLVAGESALADSSVRGFAWSAGTLTDLGTLGGNYSTAWAVGDDGTVVGESTVAGGDVHGFAWKDGAMTDLGTLGGSYSTALTVNRGGQIIGRSELAAGGPIHAFLYSQGTMTDLGTLGGDYSFALDINSQGQVVGSADTSFGQTHAFLYDNGTMTDLNDLLPEDSGWELISAEYINDAGRIVGYGVLDGLNQWFVLDLESGSSNNPPVAVAGPDQTVDCQAQVTLDGSGSSDPDGDLLSYEWSLAGSVLGTEAMLNVSLGIGTNVVTLKVTDPDGLMSEDTATVIVSDTTPPSGSCPEKVTVTVDATCQAAVPDLAAELAASDNCTAPESLLITQEPAAGTLVGIGAHTVTLTVCDASGNCSTCSVLLLVEDSSAPVIVSVPGPITASANRNGVARVPDVRPDVVVQGGCSGSKLTLKQNPAPRTKLGPGEYEILVTVTDAAGNSASAPVQFNVVDTTPPEIVNWDLINFERTGKDGRARVPDIRVTAHDNCTPDRDLVKVQQPAAGSLVGPGFYTIRVTVTDAAGNSDTVNSYLLVYGGRR